MVGKKYEGAPAHQAPLLLLTSHFLLLRRHQLGQPALLSRRGILVHDVLLGRAVEQLYGFRVGLSSLRAGGGPHSPECRAECAPLGTVLDRAGTTLTHALRGGLDTGLGYLSIGKVASVSAP